MSFYVTRTSLSAWRDEDKAMANKTFGPYETREDAIMGLNCELRKEAQGWAEYNRGPASPAIFQRVGELRMAAELVAEHNLDGVTIDNLRFAVREW